MPFEVSKHYLEEVRRQLEGYKRLGEGALNQLKDEDFFVMLDAESNSIAIIVKHITGNMRSRSTDLLTTDGEKPDRMRSRKAPALRWSRTRSATSPTPTATSAPEPAAVAPF